MSVLNPVTGDSAAAAVAMLHLCTQGCHLVCNTLVSSTTLFRRGSDLLVKLINPDAARPAVDLESQQLVTALMKLMLGDQVSHNDNHGQRGLSRSARVPSFCLHETVLLATVSTTLLGIAINMLRV